MENESASDRLGEALAGYTAGRVSRRSFLKAAAAVGVSASTASTLLAACSSSSSGSGKPSSTGKPISGGTFREGYDRDFTPPNPVNSAWADPDYNALFEAIIMRDPMGAMVPMLADSFSSDATGWKFHLREGLKFQSGAPVTADAVATDFKLFANLKTGANGVFWTPVTNITTNGQNIVCATTHSFRALQETLCTEYAYIMNPVTWKAQGASYGTKPTDGTGPFVLSSYVPGQHVVAKRWEKYPGSQPGIYILLNINALPKPPGSTDSPASVLRALPPRSLPPSSTSSCAYPLTRWRYAARAPRFRA